jgi:hypothetical protein
VRLQFGGILSFSCARDITLRQLLTAHTGTEADTHVQENKNPHVHDCIFGLTSTPLFVMKCSADPEYLQRINPRMLQQEKPVDEILQYSFLRIMMRMDLVVNLLRT